MKLLETLRATTDTEESVAGSSGEKHYNNITSILSYSARHTRTYNKGRSVYCIDADPNNDSVFISATHSGEGVVHDLRSNDGKYC